MDLKYLLFLFLENQILERFRYSSSDNVCKRLSKLRNQLLYCNKI